MLSCTVEGMFFMFDFYDFDLKKNSFLKSDDELYKLYDIYIYIYIYIYILYIYMYIYGHYQNGFVTTQALRHMMYVLP